MSNGCRVKLLARILGHSKYTFPVWFGWGILPRPVKFHYYISPPLHLEGGPEDIADRDLVERNRNMARDVGMEMIEEGLRRRKSLWFG